MQTLGNTELMKLHKVGYFASNKIATLSVLPTLDWAAEIADREDVADEIVVSSLNPESSLYPIIRTSLKPTKNL